MIIQLEADAQNRIGCLVLDHSGFEERLTKLATEVERGSHVAVSRIVAAVVQLLAEFPAGLPSLFLQVSLAREIEYSFSVYGAQAGQSVAQCPALGQRRLERYYFFLRIFELSNRLRFFVSIRFALSRGRFIGSGFGDALRKSEWARK